MLRITRVRIAVQAFSFGLFLFFCFVTQFGTLKGYPVSLFLQVDPLVAMATAVATHALYRELIWALWLLIPTLLLGRFFCNWLCPYGILHQLTGWLFNRRSAKQRIESNRYRPLYAAKYYILAALLAAAAFGTVQVGLLDPICLVFRSFSVSVLPALNMPTGWVYGSPHVHQLGWVVGGILILLVGMNLAVPRFFCRALCPLGAMLGVLSRLSLWRVERDPGKCTGCELCLGACEGACDPHASLRKSECFVCFNCVEDCPSDALTFRFLPSHERELAGPAIGSRRTLLAGFLGMAFYPLARTTGRTTTDFDKRVIRPPGSVAEHDFLARCVKCDQCIRVCPTNVLQPALLEASLEGLWTPVMNMRLGYCELNCVLCGHVCPTGAVQRLTIPQKLGIAEFQKDGPVKIGTAFYDRGRCLPWAMGTPCVVCQEVCPTSPKAVYTRPVTITDRWGRPVTLQRPYVDPSLCIGCGICEHECPVKDERAIRVTPVGETRSTDRRLLLEGGGQPRPEPGGPGAGGPMPPSGTPAPPGGGASSGAGSVPPTPGGAAVPSNSPGAGRRPPVPGGNAPLPRGASAPKGGAPLPGATPSARGGAQPRLP